MEPAFPSCVGLPPPAAGALRLAGLHRPGAGLAPDREKALRVKRIDRHPRGLGEPHHFLARPIEERRDLDQPALLIPSGEFYPTALRSEEHTSELQSLMRISYAVFCLQKQKIQ